MKKSIKKIMSLVMAAVVVVSGVASTEASAASKAKVRFNVYCYTADEKWLAGDGSTAPLVAKTVTVKKGKTVHVSMTVKGSGKKGIGVLTVDSGNTKLSGSGATKGVLDTFKSAKYSNVVVKCDGKTVKAPSQQGQFEKNEGTQSWRLSFYNQWGSQGDTTITKCKSNAKKIKFKKTCEISFDFVAK